MKLSRLVITGSLSLATGLLVAGCPNTGTSGTGTGSTLAKGTSPSIGSTGPNGTTGSSGGTTAGAGSKMSFTIITAVATGASGGSGVPTFTLDFNAGNPNNNLNNVCQVSSSGAAGPSGNSAAANFNPSLSCLCSYTWGVTNTTSSQVITRTITSQPTSVTAFEAQCPGPGVYNDPNEMPVGTTLQISLVPDVAAGNNSGFTTNIVSFTIQPVGQSGDFRDIEGESFINVYHYTCFDILQKATLAIGQKVTPVQGNGTAQVSALAANQFQATSAGLSAESYYFDFYVLANQLGNVSQNNGLYVCPTVNIGGTPSYFPMDSQFAVALQQGPNFPVTICARSGAAGGSGASAASGGGGGQPVDLCNGGSTVGFAASPNADGSCPAFTDTTGTVRPTYRLRQFTATYPLRYDGDGNLADKDQRNNTIYVLDRPVDKASENPLKPITRLGPKPCPFSYATAQFGQACTTNAALTGWNIDGIQINGNPKCPIYPPLPQPNLGAPKNTQVSMAVKPDGTLVMRPFRPFLPHYIENNSLPACAFRSTDAKDPPIVLSHDGSIFPNSNPSDFYCANYYPQAGSIIPQPGNSFTKSPGACSLADSAAAIKTDKSYSCFKTFDPSAKGPGDPQAGCCQICSGTNCTSVGGGKTPAGRNAAFSPPRDRTQGANPVQAIKQLPAAVPNRNGGGGCFDPDEDS